MCIYACVCIYMYNLYMYICRSVYMYNYALSKSVQGKEKKISRNWIKARDGVSRWRHTLRPKPDLVLVRRVGYQWMHKLGHV